MVSSPKRVYCHPEPVEGRTTAEQRRGLQLLLLGALGVALGFGAAVLVERTSTNPLLAPLIAIAGVALVAAFLRRSELLEFLIAGGVFAYCTYIGMSIVRTSGVHNFVGSEFRMGANHWGSAALLDGINLVTLLTGIPFAFALTLIVALPLWALLQRRALPLERDAEFWQFVHEESRLK